MTSDVEFTAIPSLAHLTSVGIDVAASPGPGVTAVGIPVGDGGDPPDDVGTSRAALAALGFTGTAGTVQGVSGGDGPVRYAVGVGDTAALDADGVRDAAAAFARAAGTHAALAFSIAGLGSVDAAAAAQAAVEGVLLARYRYDSLRTASTATPVASVTILAADAAAADGAARARAFAAATSLARDLANTPHSHLNATDLADLATAEGPGRGLEVEVFDKDQLVAMGCGGLLGVNAGSAEPPRMIKLTFRPAEAGSGGRLALVAKGIMYDSGGLAVKPGDEVHAQMKNDMSGAAAVMAAMFELAELGCSNTVTGWLMCTDNMPSGTAMALGDVITIRGGTTVEVINTDAEGRLVMADALVLATEESHDAIVDIATLTGACMRALGTKVAGVMGNNEALIGQVRAASGAVDEAVWPLPLERRYRSELDSTVADLRNLGGANGGAITAALFLAEFVGDVPWAHIDIAGTAQSTGDAGWQTGGCTGFGARLLLQLALDFQPVG